MQPGSWIKVELWQSQFIWAQSPIHLNVISISTSPAASPFPNPEPSPGLRGSDQENTITTFSPLSPWTPGAPISPWKTTGNSLNCKHASPQGIFPSLFRPGGCCPLSCISFWQTTLEEPLISTTCNPNQTGDVPDPILSILCSGNAERENTSCRYEW